MGGVRHYNTLSDADDCWCGGASIGPAADGRIKPDLVGNGVFLLSTWWPDLPYYAVAAGTSMASPNVANLAGKMLSVYPGLTPADLISIIVETGDPIAEPFNGRIANEKKAINEAKKRKADAKKKG